MLKRKSLLLIVCMLTVMTVAGSGDFVLSFDGVGGGGGTAAWVFTYPTDGEVCTSAPTYIGTGPPNSTAILSIYSDDNTIAGGTYSSELTLRSSRFVDTQVYDVWYSGAFGSDGFWYASVVPRSLAEGLETPVLVPSGREGISGIDVDAFCFLSGGDGVGYSIVSESAP